jgi:flagellar basal body P-ring protein FlgI
MTGSISALSQGTLVSSILKALSGQTFTTAQGTLTPDVVGGISVALTGQSYGVTQGTLVSNISKGLIAQTFSLLQGFFTVQGGRAQLQYPLAEYPQTRSITTAQAYPIVDEQDRPRSVTQMYPIKTKQRYPLE